MFQKFVIFALFIFAIIAAVEAKWAPCANCKSLLSLTNAQRKHYGRKALAGHSGLYHVSQEHNGYQAKHNTMTHAPSLTGRKVLKKYYPHWCSLGENVAYNSGACDIKWVINAWMHSPGHKANILNPGFKVAGMWASYDAKHKKCWYTQNFGGSYGCGKRRSTEAENAVVDEFGDYHEYTARELEAVMGSSDYSDDSSYDSNAPDVYDSDSAEYANVFSDFFKCTQTVCASGKCFIEYTCNRTCTPTTTCKASKRSCGYLWDGCQNLDCGACKTGQTCYVGDDASARVCKTTGCLACPATSKCTNGKCVCPLGTSLIDNACVSNSALPDSDDISAFTVTGTWQNNWVDTDNTTVDELLTGDGNGIEKVGAGAGLALWKNSEAVSGQVLVFSANVLLSAGNSGVGLVFRYVDAKNFLSVQYADGKISFGQTQNGKVALTGLGSYKWTVGDWHELKVVMRANQYEVLVDDVLFPANSFVTGKGAAKGSVGLTTDGPANFGDISYRTRSIIRLPKNKCPTTTDEEDEAVERLAYTFNLAVGAHQIKHKCQIGPKRDVAEVATMVIEGSADMPYSEGLVSGLQEMSATGDISIGANELVIEAVPEVLADVAIGSVEIIAVEAAVAAAVSAGVIAGAVVGGVVGVGALAGAGVVVHKKVQQRKKKQPQAQEMTESKSVGVAKPKGAGANVFDLDPNNHTSITGRSPMHATQV